jgi:hypothetical protein
MMSDFGYVAILNKRNKKSKRVYQQQIFNNSGKEKRAS